MESAGAWAGPYELQLAMNWTAEEAPAADDAQVWAPLQYASIVDMFGSSSCSLQPYVVPASGSSSGGQQQLVDYNYYNYYAAAAQHHDPTGKGTMTQEDLLETCVNRPKELFQEKKQKFNADHDARFMKTKMHRYPPRIGALDEDKLYTVPRVVAIGPYHHYGGDHLKQAEEVKQAAACHCITESGLEVEEMYHAVVSVVAEIDARALYHKDVMAGISDDDFLPMMFFDACFLVTYMLKKSGTEFDRVLYDFFESNGDDIAHDIMLLENQIPLQVVDAVMNKCTSEPLQIMKGFTASCKDGCLQDQVLPGFPPVDWDEDYKAPHLLGLLRYYVVGKRRSSSSRLKVSDSDLKKMETESIPISAGAIELAEMGIFLTANDTTELPDMGLSKKWIFLAELSMAPLSLTDARASLLVNMAALELCTTPDFFDDEATFEDSAVCSYLLLLCMLMHKEEDVHELRANGILQGAGLTNKKALDFFTSLQSLRLGRCYGLVMVQIASYRMNRPWIKLYGFCYRHRNTIGWAASAIGGFIGIITTLIKLKGAH